MKTFCGTDIVKISRIKDLMENEKFLDKVYTDREIYYCKVNNMELKAQHFAGRFAAKEAIYKAIPNSKNVIKSWKSIEILAEEGIHTKPKVYIDGFYKENIDVSISHEKEYAIAMCIYEGE